MQSKAEITQKDIIGAKPASYFVLKKTNETIYVMTQNTIGGNNNSLSE